MNPLQDENLRQLLLRDLMSAHQLTHKDVAFEVGRSVKTVGHWMEANMRRPVPVHVITHLVLMFPTPYSRRQVPIVFNATNPAFSWQEIKQRISVRAPA